MQRSYEKKQKHKKIKIVQHRDNTNILTGT